MADTRDFILRHKVFRLEELQTVYRESGRPAKSAREALKHHLKEGQLHRVRRGVYAHPEWVDPWLIASKLADPAIISHDGALSFHELTGVGHSLTFLTTERTSVARHQDIIFQPLRVDKHRIDWSRAEEHEREGQRVLVTTIDAALVDCLALLNRSPPLDELMAAFKQAKGRAKPAAMIQHALNYENKLLCTRLRFFLLCADYYLDPQQESRLKRHSAKRQIHFQRSKATQSDRNFPPLNLVVPSELYAFLPGLS